MRAFRPDLAVRTALAFVVLSTAACEGKPPPRREITPEDIAFANRFADAFAASVAETDATADILEVAVDECLHATRAAEQRRGCHRITEAGDRHGKESETREQLFAEYVARFGERPLSLGDERASGAFVTFSRASESLRALVDRIATQYDRVDGVLRRIVMEQRYEEE